jgi:pimeloyl-ACP methyl ester carboxylesterase
VYGKITETAILTAILSLVIVLAAGDSAAEGSAVAVVDTLVDVGGVHLNFRIIKGGEPVVLFESGGGWDHHEWDKIAPDVAARTGATVVCYDRAGFGDSDLPEIPCDIRVEGEWLWKGLEDLSLDKGVVLVGHSYGGWMIRMESSLKPQAVKGIVFIDPFNNGFVEALGVEYLDQHPMTGIPPFAGDDPSTLTRDQRALVRMIGEGLGPKLAAMQETNIPKEVPVIVLKACLKTMPEEHEQVAWEKSIVDLAESIEGAKLVLAKESSHTINFSEPELIVDTVVEVVRAAGFRD